jgi:hypothetical protein
MNFTPQADAAGNGSCGDSEAVRIATAPRRAGTDQLCELHAWHTTGSCALVFSIHGMLQFEIVTKFYCFNLGEFVAPTNA